MKKLVIFLLMNIIFLPVIASAASYVLKLGSQCEAVVALQLVLSEEGYIEEKYITGYYGEITQEAVRQYQEDHGYSVDGVAGESTLRGLLGENFKGLFDVERSRSEGQISPDSQSSGEVSNEVPLTQVSSVNANSGAAVEAGALFLGVESDFIVILQERLRDLGYLDIDRATNYFGELTEKALIAFQKANGLSADGVAGTSTLNVLFSSAAVSASESGYTNMQSEKADVSYSNTDTSELGQKVVETALAQLGKPYEYNARGAGSFDCSGLVYYCFKIHGVTLPTSSSTQAIYEGGIRIDSVSSLQAGDVVFLNTGNKYVDINHCGIYIGNGQFIHASSGANAVIIRPIDSGFYYTAFRWALRIVK